jgi:hypothetical protein
MEKIALMDMDGVIVDFIGGIISSLSLPCTPGDFSSWSHHLTLGISDEEFWAPTRESGWWERLEPLPWAADLLSAVRESGYKVIFCSSPGLDSKSLSEKVNWLRYHGFMDERKNDYQFGPLKFLNAKSGAVLIDDSDSNVDAYVEQTGKAILVPQAWNRASHEVGLSVTRYVLDKLLRM